jgi:LAO/AO transport system kinase
MLKNTLAILRPASPNWRPSVLAVSALTGDGVARFWSEVERYRGTMRESGEFARRRRGQAQDWMWQLIDERLRARGAARAVGPGARVAGAGEAGAVPI